MMNQKRKNTICFLFNIQHSGEEDRMYFFCREKGTNELLYFDFHYRPIFYLAVMKKPSGESRVRECLKKYIFVEMDYEQLDNLPRAVNNLGNIRFFNGYCERSNYDFVKVTLKSMRDFYKVSNVFEKNGKNEDV